MTTLTTVRCQACGSSRSRKAFHKAHVLDATLVTSGGRAKIQNTKVALTPTEEVDLIDEQVEAMEQVIARLKKRRRALTNPLDEQAALSPPVEMLAITHADFLPSGCLGPTAHAKLNLARAYDESLRMAPDPTALWMRRVSWGVHAAYYLRMWDMRQEQIRIAQALAHDYALQAFQYVEARVQLRVKIYAALTAGDIEAVLALMIVDLLISQNQVLWRDLEATIDQMGACT